MAIPFCKMGAIINYNMNPIVAGAGSVLFIHLWRSAHQETVGYVAMNEHHLLQLLNWLKKKNNPYI
jgi:L,D-peptidoglycan transpeptidase YkuD (ErfK/YbiS/YcfS/YnhG family)